MHDELRKKLDEFVAEMVRAVDEEWGPWDDPNDNWVTRKWTLLRAELESARCENCANERGVPRWLDPDGSDGLLLCKKIPVNAAGGIAMPLDFCCKHFEAKT
jgi:hypothetical protein